MGLVGQVAFLVTLSEDFLWMGLVGRVADFVVLSESFPGMRLASQVAHFVALSMDCLWPSGFSCCPQ